MTFRNTLLVGSLPFSDEKDAMTQAMEILGNSLLHVPDGEIGEKTEKYPNGNRSAWILGIMDTCMRDKENWDVLHDAQRGANGFPTDYKQMVKLKPKYAAKDININFGYLDAFQKNYPIFQQLRKEKGFPHLTFQVGIPTGLAIGMCMLKPLDAYRYQDVFNSRLAYEVNEIAKIAGDDVVIQIEAPVEVSLSEQLPKIVNKIAVNSLLGLIDKLDPCLPLGLHLCWGDLKNKACTHVKSLEKLVYFSNRLLQNWQSSHHLDYIHFPLAAGDIPPVLDESFYKPLKYVHMPEDVRFVAGFIHEKRSFDELKKILQIVEFVRGRTVDIACSCGLGRRDPEVAMHLLQLTHQLSLVDISVMELY
jgi:hypothetical protein